MEALSLLLLVVEIATIFLAIAIYFMVKRLTSKSLYTKRWAWFAVVVLYAMQSSYIWTKYNAPPSPTDEYMIKHFREHRAELDALVKAYREEHLLPDPLMSWDSSEQIKEIKIKVDVSGLSSKSTMWFDNPYSHKSADDFEKKIKEKSINIFTNHSFDGVIV